MRYSSLPTSQLSAWAHLNDVSLNGFTVSPSIIDKDGKDKGGGLVASDDHGPGELLLTIPRDLLLSSPQIDECARTDRQLHEVLKVVGSSFSQNSRKKTMLFILMQLTYSSPDFKGKGDSMGSPFTDYVKMLPKKVSLPTFYNSNERGLLQGTSLADILALKLNSLAEEFDHLRSTTASVPWCQRHWWDEEHDQVSIDDWKLADALYRSRSVGLPKDDGTAMVPVLDMANHAEEGQWNARFDVDEVGRLVLVVHDTKHIKRGEEITIMYSNAGASELLFSYGFLDNHMATARELFLGFEMPDDDPLALAKAHFSEETPGIRIYHDEEDIIHWESPLVWWNCINEEDGLDFSVAQTIDGGTELQATWKGINLTPSANLAKLLMEDESKDLFLLRATVLVQQRIELQGHNLDDSEEFVDNISPSRQDIINLGLIRRLRFLERETLSISYEQLDATKAQLLGSEAVQGSLLQNQAGRPDLDNQPEDFS